MFNLNNICIHLGIVGKNLKVFVLENTIVQDQNRYLLYVTYQSNTVLLEFENIRTCVHLILGLVLTFKINLMYVEYFSTITFISILV